MKAQFKVAEKRYLNTYSFSSVEEFLLSKNVSPRFVINSVCGKY
jgi:hypothetical protein